VDVYGDKHQGGMEIVMTSLYHYVRREIVPYSDPETYGQNDLLRVQELCNGGGRKKDPTLTGCADSAGK